MDSRVEPFPSTVVQGLIEEREPGSLDPRHYKRGTAIKNPRNGRKGCGNVCRGDYLKDFHRKTHTGEKGRTK